MNKKVLVIHYSQSGQLHDIVSQFTKPFAESDVLLDVVRIHPVKDFSFPWTSERFFDAMPESVLGIPLALSPLSFKEQSYDLVVIAYQPWYLSPSIPITSVFEDVQFKHILKDTPVITLIGARNMWLNAQEKIKLLLQKSGARLVGNLALVDRHSNLVSVVTILYWMLTGKKDKYLGIFPKPGVSEQDVLNSSKYGKMTLSALLSGSWDTLQKKIVEAKGVEIDSDLMFIEQRAGRLFSIWAGIIVKRRNRKLWLKVFKYYLLVALFIVAPVVLLVNKILFRPFVGNRIRRKKEYYLGLS